MNINDEIKRIQNSLTIMKGRLEGVQWALNRVRDYQERRYLYTVDKDEEQWAEERLEIIKKTIDELIDIKTVNPFFDTWKYQ